MKIGAGDTTLAISLFGDSSITITALPDLVDWAESVFSRFNIPDFGIAANYSLKYSVQSQRANLRTKFRPKKFCICKRIEGAKSF